MCTVKRILLLAVTVAAASHLWAASAGGNAVDSTVRLTYSVTADGWHLVSVSRPAPAVVRGWPVIESSFYLVLETEDGDIILLRGLGHPQRQFYDYLDEKGELAGGAIVRSDFTCSFPIPNLAQDYRLKIFAADNRLLYQADREEILRQQKQMWRDYPVYAVDTLLYNGDPAKKIDIVILGDGYILEDTTIFLNHCNNHLNYVFNRIPFEQYSERFNVYAITTISNQRGADHPEWGVFKDTYYDSEYWGRLLVINETTAWGVLQEHAPQGEQIWALVQDPTYGGSGGFRVAVSYSASTQVLAHEFGHSFGALWDEYSYGGAGSVGDAPNCDDFLIDPKWQAWIDSAYPGVGTFSGCTWDNTFRPTYYGCMMLSLTDDYCVVCREQIINRIYQDAPNPIDATLPGDTLFVEPGWECSFIVDYANSHDYPQALSWYLDEELQIGADDTSFAFTPVLIGQYLVKVQLQDTTGMVLNLPDSAMRAFHTWTVNADSAICGDADGNDIVNVSDAVYLIAYIFAGGPPPDFLIRGDPDCNQIVNISDAVYLIGYVFAGGPAPCEVCP